MAVEYALSWGDPNERLYDVEVRFTAPADDPVLFLATWRPGRYLIQNFAANVRDWSANVPVAKSGKSEWTLSAKRGERITMRYRYFAGFLDAGSSFLDPSEAYFNPSNLFMRVEGLRSEPVRLALAVDPSWTIETQLGRGTGGVFEARDWDALVDAPFIAAPSLRRHSFEVSGAMIHLVFAGAEGIDTEQYVEPLRAIVLEQAAMFRGLPMKEYRFLNHISDKWHGVEHEESCSIIARRDAMDGAKPGDEGYDHFLSISAHEFFHVWNVKRILPAVFAPYDFSRETPTRLLWAMEGTTSYFGSRSIVRAGVWDEAHYLEHLAKEISTYESSPARHHLSLEQASFDGWLQDPSRPQDRGNAWYSFYNKGEIVSALLDLQLRRDGHTLDEVWLALWSDYGQKGRGLEEDAVERVVSQIAGRSYADFFERYVRGTAALPYAELFAAAGVALDSKPRPLSLGAQLRSSDGSLLVDATTRGGTAMAAGLLPGDELVGVGRVRTRSEKDVERALRGAGEGDPVELTVARNGMVEQRRAALRHDASVEVKLRITEQENALRRSWLGRTE